MPPGVMVHRPGNSCLLRGRPEADLTFLIQEQAFQSNPAHAAQSLMSIKLRLMYTMQNAHTMPM